MKKRRVTNTVGRGTENGEGNVAGALSPKESVLRNAEENKNASPTASPP
jgi:hypothetical protein